jgi:Domain of unknown function (DUF1814).
MSRSKPHLITKRGISVSQRLRNLAAKEGRLHQQVLQRFGLEAAIRRIFASDQADRFGLQTSLKGGALMFFAEGVSQLDGRTTTDIDLQLSGWTGTMEDLAAALRDALAVVPLEDDGVRFDLDDIKVLKTRDGGVPGGSVMLRAQAGSTELKFKCDVGFYDPILRDTLIAVDYPSLLPDLPAIRIMRQPIEYSISDKCHAAWKHAGENTRLRDYYDLYVYLTKCTVDDDRLREAFARSWPMYGADVPASIDGIAGYSAAFVAANAVTWRGLKDSSGWAVPVPELDEVVALIRSRLEPIFNSPAPRLTA